MKSKEILPRVTDRSLEDLVENKEDEISNDMVHISQGAALMSKLSNHDADFSKEVNGLDKQKIFLTRS